MRFFELYPSEQREVESWKKYLDSIKTTRND